MGIIRSTRTPGGTLTDGELSHSKHGQRTHVRQRFMGVSRSVIVISPFRGKIQMIDRHLIGFNEGGKISAREIGEFLNFHTKQNYLKEADEESIDKFDRVPFTAVYRR